MTARKKTIAGELVTRIGEEHSGFHLLGDCDFNSKNIYGPLNIVNNNGTLVGKIDTSGLLTIAQIIVSGLTASEGVYTNGSKQLTSTPPSSGILGHWNRVGTDLSPSNSGDDIETTGTGTFGQTSSIQFTDATAIVGVLGDSDLIELAVESITINGAIIATGDISGDNINVTAGKKLNLEGSGGDTYFLFNEGTNRLELWVNGVKQKEWS